MGDTGVPDSSEASRKSIDDRLKEADLVLKERDAALKEADLESRSGWRKNLSSPLAPVLATAFAGFLVAQASSYFQAQQNDALERKKLQSALFQKMIETGNQEASAKNLLFILHLGLIDDPTGKIAALENNPQDAPVLSSPAGVVVPSTPTALAAFFDQYRSAFGAVTAAAASNLTQLFNFIAQDKSITDVRNVAYILATIKFETANTFAPITDMCKGDCPPYGVKYKGRGYIQLTWEANYKKLGDILNIDLLNNPELANDPKIAYQITSSMMENGLATGKKLGDYITKEKTDYVGARRIISGSTDHDQLIAGYAEKFEAILRQSLSVSTATSQATP